MDTAKVRCIEECFKTFAPQVFERQADQLAEGRIAVDHDIINGQAKRFKGCVGECGQAFSFFDSTLVFDGVGAQLFLLLKIVEERIEGENQTFRLIARIHRKADIEICRPAHQMVHRLFDMADTDTRGMFGLVEAVAFCVCSDTNAHNPRKYAEEKKPCSKRPDKIEDDAERLHEQLRYTVTGWKVRDGRQKREQDRTDNTCKGVRADRANGVINFELSLEKVIAPVRCNSAGKAHKDGARNGKRSTPGCDGHQTTNQAAKDFLRQNGLVADHRPEIASGCPRRACKDGVRYDEADGHVGRNG